MLQDSLALVALDVAPSPSGGGAIAAPRPEPVAATPVLLALDGVSLAFGGVTALADIDLAVGEGEIRAVIGPNGAGKSSLINVVSGLYRPQRGRIRLAGETFSAVPTERLARLGVARTFQNLALFKGLTVLDNVLMGLTSGVRSGLLGQVLGLAAARREDAENREAALAMLDFLHLGSLRDRGAGTLPYGVQKRIELARALVAQPRLLLLDEPMAGMTLTEKREMTGFIRDARDTYGTTIVLIEHDIGVVMGLSDRVAVLDYGRKIADGTPDEVRADQAVIDAYLGVAHDDDGEVGL
jgi:branched-chain amino acid transport system ATP-binding protein